MERPSDPSDDSSLGARKFTLMGVKAPFYFKKEEELLYLKIQIKKTRIDALVNTGSQSDFISKDLMAKFVLKVTEHP